MTGKKLPSERAFERARRSNAERARLERHALLADTLTTADVAARLALTAEDVEVAARDGQLLVLRHDGAAMFPAWQLVGEQERARVVAGLQGVLLALPTWTSELSRARWFVTPKDQLGGDTPAAWLRRGRDSDAVIEAARASGAA